MKKFFRELLEVYEHRINLNKYWKRRIGIQNYHGVRKLYCMIWCRRQEAKFGAATGIGMATEASPCCIFNIPICLPHGLSGIIIARNVIFEGNATIFQHVTIAESDKEKTTHIGDNALIGAGAVILNNSRIGKNAKIGANAVVLQDVPDGCTAVGVPAKIIKKS